MTTANAMRNFFKAIGRTVRNGLTAAAVGGAGLAFANAAQAQQNQPQASYYVVKIPNWGYFGNGILSVRSEAALQRGIPFNAFTHGGNSGANANLERVSGPHTRQEASRVLGGMIVPNTLRKPAHSGGQIASVGGGKFLTIDSMGDLDFAQLNNPAPANRQPAPSATIPPAYNPPPATFAPALPAPSLPPAQTYFPPAIPAPPAVRVQNPYPNTGIPAPQLSRGERVERTGDPDQEEKVLVPK